ncbi:MAG: TolC family protein [Odoribacteraceae bacterium]|jgi:outer membrane protein TolC|nr:TolC family protein [Odoribacteraceae bacterium]
MKKLFFALLFCSLGAAAQRPLTLDTCRAMALDNNREGAIAREKSRQLGFLRASARANFFPSLSASAFYARTGLRAREEIRGDFISRFVQNGWQDLNPGTPLPPGVEGVLQRLDGYLPAIPLDLRVRDTYAGGLLLRQPLYMGGKVRAGYNMAKIGQEMAGCNERLTRADVIVRSDEAFWLCVKAREMVALALAYRESVREFLERVENARELGLRGRNDLLKVQVQLNDAELSLLRARNGRRLADMNLCRVTGLPVDSEIEVEGRFPDDSPVPLLPAPPAEERPEYALLSKMIDLKEEEVKLTRADFLPNIGVQGTYGYLNGVELNGKRLFDKTSFAALLSVSVPVFHWNEGRNKIRAARSEREIASLQRDEAKDMLAMETTLARQAVEESRAEIALARRALAQAEENLKVSGDQYELGLETISDHLAARALCLKARANLVEAQANLHLNETRYLKATDKL